METNINENQNQNLSQEETSIQKIKEETSKNTKIDKTPLLTSNPNNNPNQNTKKLFPSLKPLIILFPVFLYFCAFEMLEAVDPKLITELISKNIKTQNKISKPLVEASKYEIKLQQAITIPALLVVGIYGEFSDRYGRKIILLVHTFVSIVAHIILAFVAQASNNVYQFYAGYIFLGLAGSIFTYLFAVFSYTADLTTFSQKAYYFGLVEAACYAGHIIGPFFGGFLYDQVGRWFPYLISALLLLATFIYYLFFVKESLLVNNRRSFSQKNANPFASISILLFNRSTFTIFSLIFCFCFTTTTLSISLILYTSQVFKQSTEDVGEFLSILWLFRAIAVLIIVPIVLKYVEKLNTNILSLSKKFQGPMILIRISLFASMISSFAFAFVKNSIQFYLVALIFALGSIDMVGVRTIFCNAVSQQQHGLILSAIGSMEIILRALDTLFYNYIYSLTYSTRLPSAFFLFAALCSLIGILLSFMLNEKDFIHVERKGDMMEFGENCGNENFGLLGSSKSNFSRQRPEESKTEIKPLSAFNMERSAEYVVKE